MDEILGDDATTDLDGKPRKSKKGQEKSFQRHETLIKSPEAPRLETM